MLATIKSKHLDIVFPCEASSDARFVFHNFNVMSLDKWLNFLDTTDSNIFVFPLEMDSEENMKAAYMHPKISKIVVASEFAQKYFVKTLGISPSKLKLIYLPGLDLRGNAQKLPYKKIITPTYITETDEIISLIEAFSMLKKRYKNLVYEILVIPSVKNKDTLNDWVSSLSDYIDENNLRGYVQIIVLGKPQTYAKYFVDADIILLPHDESTNLYSGPLIDAVVNQKPVVASNTPHCYDVIKKDAGLFLYQAYDVHSIVDACAIILDNKDIKDIMVKENAVLSGNFQQTKISQQYLNLFRRHKE
jgi:glycosyltransferase involved in cell wall biosynthesis